MDSPGLCFALWMLHDFGTNCPRFISHNSNKRSTRHSIQRAVRARLLRWLSTTLFTESLVSLPPRGSTDRAMYAQFSLAPRTSPMPATYALLVWCNQHKTLFFFFYFSVLFRAWPLYTVCYRTNATTHWWGNDIGAASLLLELVCKPVATPSLPFSWYTTDAAPLFPFARRQCWLESNKTRAVDATFAPARAMAYTKFETGRFQARLHDSNHIGCWLLLLLLLLRRTPVNKYILGLIVWFICRSYFSSCSYYHPFLWRCYMSTGISVFFFFLQIVYLFFFLVC